MLGCRDSINGVAFVWILSSLASSIKGDASSSYARSRVNINELAARHRIFRNSIAMGGNRLSSMEKRRRCLKPPHTSSSPVEATTASSASFWSNPSLDMKFRPPPSILSRIQQAPWRGGLEPAGDIEEYQPRVVGEIPSDMKGVLYRNGAGRVRVGEHKYGHWFDGDGYITRMELDGKLNRATFTGRYVRTERFNAQSSVSDDAGFQLRGAWTQRAGGVPQNLGRNPTNPGNTATIDWNGRLLALCEGGPPMDIDPKTLHTVGEYAIKGLNKGAFFSAHPQVDTFRSRADDKIMFNHGLVLGYPMKLRVYKVQESQGVVGTTDISLEELAFIHDFASTEDFLVFILHPYVCPISKVLTAGLGLNSLGREFRWQGGGGGGVSDARVIVIDKKDMSVRKDAKVPALSFDHMVNAHQEGGSQGQKSTIKVQLLIHKEGSREEMEANRFDMYNARFSERTLPTLHEIELDVSPTTPSTEINMKTREISPLLCELPTINQAYTARESRFAFVNALEVLPNGATPGFLNAIGKIDMKTGIHTIRGFGPTKYAGEPVFAARENSNEEDDGYVLTYVYDSMTHKSKLVILDAKDIQGNSLAEVELEHHVPHSFHGGFVPSSQQR